MEQTPDAEYLPTYLIEALHELPRTGKIRGKRDQHIIKSVFFLVDRVPDSDPRKQEIKRLASDALRRSEF